MKKLTCILITLLLLTAGGVSAQHYIGVRGGWGGGSARFYPNREMGYEWGLYSGGISYKFYGPTNYVGAVQADLQYMERGFNYDIERYSDTSYHRTLKSIELPFMWQPHVYLLTRHMRVFLNLGVYMNYNFDSEYRVISKREGIVEQGNYPFRLTRDNRLGYGLCVGFGFGVLMGRFEAALEGRYYYGFSDILRNVTKYPDNPVRSPLDNINASLAFYYRLGKGGIRAEPGKALAAKLAEQETKRLLKLEEKGKLSPEELRDLELLREADLKEATEQQAEKEINSEPQRIEVNPNTGEVTPITSPEEYERANPERTIVPAEEKEVLPKDPNDE